MISVTNLSTGADLTPSLGLVGGTVQYSTVVAQEIRLCQQVTFQPQVNAGGAGDVNLPHPRRTRHKYYSLFMNLDFGKYINVYIGQVFVTFFVCQGHMY